MLHIANFGGLIKIYGNVDCVSAQAKLHRLAENSCWSGSFLELFRVYCGIKTFEMSSIKNTTFDLFCIETAKLYFILFFRFLMRKLLWISA